MEYDAANRYGLIANRACNRVEILSTQDGSRVDSVDVAGASSADSSSDGRVIWVGTLTEQIAAIDTHNRSDRSATLSRVVNQCALSGRKRLMAAQRSLT
jgi:hypothetical protein